MNKFGKIIAAVVALGVLAVSVIGVYATTRAEQKTTFAYIDTVRLWNELPQMAQMREILERETAEKQKAFDAEVAKLTDDQAKRDLFNKYQSELEARKDELFEAALQQTYELIKQVATEQGIDLVLDKQGVLYGGLDLTDQVIAAAKAGVK
ncbi:MAG: OmpH family outer membrane protein [Firmicutes bacterium]|nr:OmpH family outer membrane protein [Bacillota bacterium]